MCRSIDIGQIGSNRSTGNQDSKQIKRTFGSSTDFREKQFSAIVYEISNSELPLRENIARLD